MKHGRVALVGDAGSAPPQRCPSHVLCRCRGWLTREDSSSHSKWDLGLLHAWDDLPPDAGLVFLRHEQLVVEWCSKLDQGREGGTCTHASPHSRTAAPPHPTPPPVRTATAFPPAWSTLRSCEGRWPAQCALSSYSWLSCRSSLEAAVGPFPRHLWTINGAGWGERGRVAWAALADTTVARPS